MPEGLPDAEAAVTVPSARNPLNEARKEQIFTAHQQGTDVESLSNFWQRTKSTIRRVINEVRARHLLAQEIDFVPNPLFETLQSNPALEGEVRGPMPGLDNGEEQAAGRPPSGLPPYLASLYEIPLLTKEQEIHLFRKMNYLKYRAHRLCEGLKPTEAKKKVLDEIETLEHEALAVKNKIVCANLRLVVSFAKRRIGSGLSFDELVSNGNMSLMRAVKKFDYARGNKFSTYAAWAIIRDYSRQIPAEHSVRQRHQPHDEEWLKNTVVDHRADERAYEGYLTDLRSALGRVLRELDERERAIIEARFGLGEYLKPHTLEAVGKIVGITKERIRQIEQRTIKKLRTLAENDGLELPDEALSYVGA